MVRPCVSLNDRRGKPGSYVSEQASPVGLELPNAPIAHGMRIRSAPNWGSLSGRVTARVRHFGASVTFRRLFIATIILARQRHLDLFENRGYPLILTAPMHHHNRSSLKPLVR